MYALKLPPWVRVPGRYFNLLLQGYKCHLREQLGVEKAQIQNGLSEPKDIYRGKSFRIQKAVW